MPAAGPEPVAVPFARKDLYTHNPARETEMYGLCPICASKESKPLSGFLSDGVRVVVCSNGHDRVVMFDRPSQKWRCAR
jgi:hypothetical protein